MSKCPNCKKEVAKPEKKWKYGRFTVQSYSCPNCKTQFRDYYNKDAKCNFTLKLQDGKYRKA